MQYLEQAFRFHDAGKLDDAKIAYDAVLHEQAENVDALYGLGTIALQRKEYDTAKSFLEKARAGAPNSPEILVNLASAYRQLGLTKQAIDGFARAVELARGHTALTLMAATELLKLHEPHKAIQAVASLDQSDPKVVIHLARSHAALGSWGTALDALMAVTKHIKDDPAVWRELAQAAGYLRKYDLAVEAFHTYMKLKPYDVADTLALADLYLMGRMHHEATATIEKALAEGETSAVAYTIAAKCARLSGDYALAKQYLRSALCQKRYHGQAWQYLADLADEDDLSALIQDCDEQLSIGQGQIYDRSLMAFSLGRMQERQKDYTAAAKTFLLANALQKEDLSAKGVVYDPEATEIYYERLRRYFPPIGDYSTAARPDSDGKGQADRTFTPIFILGMPRSGTTLVEKILGGDEAVTMGGELETMEMVAASYFWDVERGKRPQPRQMHPADWAVLAKEYRASIPCSTPFITDKMPHNFRHAALISQTFPDSPIIYMRRDPRDVCQSIFSRQFPDGHPYSCDQEWLAHMYHQSVLLMEHWKEVCPTRIMDVSYEQLAKNPEQEARRIVAFCGLEWSDSMLDFHTRNDTSFTFSELQVRQPINVKGIGRWRHYQTELVPLLTALDHYGL
ncbi:sulfotransferase [Kordiimonas sediminis]|uniref:Sulfotransferase n=1 Tax=Kordiimonas sediminis TaxID=1735581 RepID=A0A919E3U4_9PROT|nr:sulfotransferase [Kordiimonas sediminis]GHF10373.1 sulfotransferase [Kordiimonas sediminis]